MDFLFGGQPRDWIRIVVYLLLTGLFLHAMVISFQTLSEKKVAVSEGRLESQTLLYPSVTMCPFLVSELKQYRGKTLPPDPNPQQFIKDYLAYFMHSYIKDNKTIFLNISGSEAERHPDKFYVTRHPHFVFKKMSTCLTYDPPTASPPTVAKDAMRYALSTKGVMYWTLYLHSRGNLVARTGRLYGSTFVTGAPSVVNSTVLSEHVVSLSDVKYFVGEISCDSKCSVGRAGITSCLQSYVSRHLGCSLLGNNTGTCYSTFANYEKMVDLYGRLSLMSEREIALLTGCIPCCRRYEFESTTVVNNRIDALAEQEANMLVVNFFYAGSGYEIKTHYLAYGKANLVADFGSYLGLLLGHSCLTFFDVFRALFHKLKVSKKSEK